MKERGMRKRWTAVLLTGIMTLSVFAGVTPVRTEAASIEEYKDAISTYSIDETVRDYKDYVTAYPQERPEEEYIIPAESYLHYEVSSDGTKTAPETYTDYEGMQGVSVLTTEDALIEYKVEIKTAGFYTLSLLYYPIEGKNSAIQRSLFIDGVLPYSECAVLEFYRVWQNDVTDETVTEDGVVVKQWLRDNQGNDLKPGMKEAPEWIESYLYDSEGYVTEELAVYLTEGTHTISLLSLKEPMLLRELRLSNKEKTLSYEEYLAKTNASDTSAQLIRIEAENVGKTSSQMLYPQQDQSSPAVYPSSAKELKNNTLGGNSWKSVGQWAEWEFEVPQDGYYNISLFARQNFVKGIYVSRKIMIDGEVPFEELEDYGFQYEQNWRLDTLSDENGEAYKFYLTAGRHTIRMQVVLGEFSEIISEVQEAVSDLNAIYRQVIRITGVAPDSYRDYQIEASLPELEGELIAVKEKIDHALNTLRAVAGKGSDKETVLITMSDQLEELIKDQERFVKVIGSFKINVRACGTWITQVIEQPLQLDTLYISSPDVAVEVAKDNAFSKIGYELSKLYYSFIVDYNQIGNVAADSDETITLWIGSGRDQANVIKSLIDETFTNAYGISVNVMLVDMGTLLQATLAGQGPDVAIQVGMDLPMNYGLRNAVADLSQFEDLDEILTRFNESAITSYKYEGAVYGLPETQTFPMMFYRKDILNELGLTLPTTWDEVKVTMAVLAKNQMEFGMLPSEQLFGMFLYQNDGEYYTEDATKSALDSENAVNAFKTYCEYYTDYKLDTATDVGERFRTGECPIIIADYTLYNNLQVSAPDLKGLWGFAPVPGTVKEDGTVDNTVASTGTACVVMENCENKEAAWEFLKWWTSAETQTNYGREMESLMGASARVATANMEAFANLPWPFEDYEALVEQFKNVKGIPQVPGGYFTYRNVNNAFYRVTTETDTATPREELMDSILYINAEITYKREEFGMPTAQD